MAFGVVLVIVFGAAIAAAVHFSQGLWPDLLSAAARMVLVYGAYATMVLLALGVYAVSSGDLRTLATVSVLGPFTLIRPLVISAGGVWGAIGASHGATAAIACAAAGAMIGFEPMLRARAGRTVRATR